MLNKVKEYIASHRLLSDGVCIVALSGGADSVALTHLLCKLGYNIHAAHCNFHLRGEESDRDEDFCEQLCKEHNVPFHRIHFDTREYAALHHVSIEMAARELRYSYFEQLRVAIGAEDIAVAHHRDDNIETLFLNLIRGTGIHGLEGMKPRYGHIVRPLLCLSKEEIIAFLDSIHQPYITDSSNLVPDVQRNILRLNILPLLKTVNPAALDNIQQSMEYISEAVKVYDDAIIKSKEKCLKGNTISITELKQQPSPESTLFEILQKIDFGSNLCRNISDSLDAPVGKIWQSGNWTVAKDRDTLIIDHTPQPFQQHKIPESGLYNFGTFSLKLEIQKRSDTFSPSRKADIVTLDADKVTFPLILRQARVGDTFHPFGMKGRKLVSDYLTDIKANYFEKQRQLVLEDASGNIIWLVRRRTSQKVSVTPDTINILSIRYSKE